MESPMRTLVKTIETTCREIPAWRKHSLKELPTRTIVIDPLLQALGWNVREPDEVQLEYPTVDGKSVDYALKINKKPVLLVEAKALDDPLEDVKSITQVVGYAANAGIEWCILTNGLRWKVYRSVEKCPAPDKLMYEVNLDSKGQEGLNVEQIAVLMWRFSREQVATGTLDDLGEKTFTDSKVRKAFQSLLSDPPRPFLNLVKKELRDESLSPQRIKESLIRLATEELTFGLSSRLTGKVDFEDKISSDQPRSKGAKKAWETRRARKGESPHNEDHHLSGKPQEIIELYRAIERFCLGLAPSEVTTRHLVKSINFEHDNRCFCSLHVLQGQIKLWLRLQFRELANPPVFVRDVANIGHWGVGDVEARISNREEFEEATSLIRRSFESAQ